MFNHWKKPTLRKVARKFKCSQITICKIFRKMQKQILCNKRVRKCNEIHSQRLMARPKSKRLLQVFRNVDFILEDESYFTLSNYVQTGNDTHYSNVKNLRPYGVN